jgi:hypothetical protein
MARWSAPVGVQVLDQVLVLRRCPVAGMLVSERRIGIKRPKPLFAAGRTEHARIVDDDVQPLNLCKDLALSPINGGCIAHI